MQSPPATASRNKGSNGSRPLPRYDQFMLKAKNDGATVRITLAVGIYLQDMSIADVLLVKVLEVDTFSIKVLTSWPVADSELWIAKGFIVGTEILG